MIVSVVVAMCGIVLPGMAVMVPELGDTESQFTPGGALVSITTEKFGAPARELEYVNVTVCVPGVSVGARLNVTLSGDAVRVEVPPPPPPPPPPPGEVLVMEIVRLTVGAEIQTPPPA